LGFGETLLEDDPFEAKKHNKWVEIRDYDQNILGEINVEIDYSPDDENIVLEELYEGIPKDMIPHESNMGPGATMRSLGKKKLEISIETFDTEVHDNSRYSTNYHRYPHNE